MMTISDNTPDGMWTKIGLEIPKAKERMMQQILEVIASETFYNDLRSRYAKGSDEHDNEWLAWPGSSFESNAIEEILDCILYHAMNIVREDHVRRYGNPAGELSARNMTYSEADAKLKAWHTVEDEMMGRLTDPESAA